MGHLNNARYIDYFMNAREDHLSDNYGLDIYDYMKKEGRAWVVGKSEIIYRNPALLMEEVMIQTQVNHYGKRKIMVEMAMYNKDMNQLKALLWSVFIPVDVRTQQSIEHSEDLMDLLDKVVVDQSAEVLPERLMQIEERLSVNSI